MRTRELRALAAASGLLACAIALDHGHYSPRALAVLLAGCGAAAMAVHAGLRPDDAAPGARPAATGSAAPDAWRALSLDWWLAVLLIVLLVAGALDRPGVFINAASGIGAAHAAQQWGLVALVAAFLPRLRRGGDLPVGVVGAGVLTAILFRGWIIRASPEPAIDVWWQFQQSAAHLLAGLNPYTTPVEDPTGAAERFGYVVRGYAYPPGTLLVQTLAFAAFGDVRYASLVADLVTAALVWSIARPVRQTTAALLALLVLHQPRSLFVLEQSWQEPLLAACLAATAALLLRRAAGTPVGVLVGVLAGVALSLKQYLVVFVAPFLLRCGDRATVAALLIGGLVPWLPFLLWDAPAAVQHGLWFQLQTPFRPDGLTLLSALHVVTGVTPGKQLAAVAGVATSVALAWHTRTAAPAGAWLRAGTMAMLVAFLLGSQAFANYYHLIAMLLLVLVAVRLREGGAAGAIAPGGAGG
jgi:hypothetical protein